jgi:predicted ester cyclase
MIGMQSYSQVRSNHSLINSPNQEKMEATQMQRNCKAIVRRFFEDILNTRRLEMLDQVISDEFIGFQGEKGPKGLAQSVSSLILAFPDIRWTIEDMIAEGNKVVARWSWKGTNSGSFNGHPPSNREVIHHSIVIYQLSGEKISKAWMQADRFSFFQQIGVLSPELIAPRAIKK